MDPLRIPILINKISKSEKTIMNKDVLKKYNISKIHILYLIALNKFIDGITLKDLSTFLSFDKANTTRAINHLIDISYVEKVYQKNLKLKFKVKLTDKGILVSDKLISEQTKKFEVFFDKLSDKEKIGFESVITKLENAFYD